MKRMAFFLLLLPALAACAASATHPPKHGGSIAGVIQYPGHVVPAMRICALDTRTRAGNCVETRAGQATYSVANLPAGEYYVVANIAQWELKVGGHVMQVQCIRAPCPALLKPLSLQAGQALEKIDLNGFYPARSDFPELPADTL